MEFRLLPEDGIGRLVEPSDASQLTYNLAPVTYERGAMSKVALREAAAELEEFWSQHTVGEANGNLFKVAKGIGSTNWHQHDDQDEVFIVLHGQITVQLRTGDVELNEGDLFIVPWRRALPAS